MLMSRDASWWSKSTYLLFKPIIKYYANGFGKVRTVFTVSITWDLIEVKLQKADSPTKYPFPIISTLNSNIQLNRPHKITVRSAIITASGLLYWTFPEGSSGGPYKNRCRGFTKMILSLSDHNRSSWTSFMLQAFIFQKEVRVRE